MSVAQLSAPRHRKESVPSTLQFGTLSIANLTLPTALQEDLDWFVEFLDPWFPRSCYAIGGGTALAARWEHRQSTDIDLFAEEQQFREIFGPHTWQKICEELAQRQANSEIKELSVQPTGFAFDAHKSAISFYAVPHVTNKPLSLDTIGSTGLRVEETTEIVFKKLRGRMVNSSTYVARDLYDIVVCYGLDRAALNLAFASLSEFERQALRYDVQTGETSVDNLDRVLSPSYPDLIADLEQFNRIAGDVLSQEISSDTRSLLLQLGFEH